MNYSFQTRLNNWSKSLKNRAFAISASRRTLIIFALAESKNNCRHRESETLIGKGCRKNVPKMGHFSRRCGICVVARFCWRLKSLKIQELNLGFKMNFKRRIEWRKLLAVAGWIGLGYFIGRPDQLERLARNLNNATNQPRYFVPATVRTTIAPVLVQQQPVIVATPQAQGWSQFSNSQRRFSVLLPTAPITRSADGQTFSVQTANEFYRIGCQPNIPNAQLITEKGKQLVMEQAANNFELDNFTVVGKRSFGLNGIPGVELHLRHKSSGIPPTIMRQMLVGDRLYSISVTSPYTQNAQTFLDSFRPH
ncbi:MAG: hypothetical protein JGK34_25695 [Microcoleus sp. PH2017_26_ELK_O_A]|nr:hypothetical protein [Microcoleus sp. PH2017_26_ELK_O_A]